ncbi:MAG: S8 family serine peptidase [Myxococcales bacterium]|nr:S8 family serine peptidase [Myxococcales bacterium]
MLSVGIRLIVTSVILVAVCGTLVTPGWSNPSIYDALLSTDVIGASDFRRTEQPEIDGTGVVVAVLDTGVDMGVAGLRTLPNGHPKVILVRDFSGQGTLTLHDAQLTDEDGVPTLRYEDIWVRGFATLSIPPHDPPQTFQLAQIDETRFRKSEVQDLNGNGSKTDRFTILVYPSAQSPTGPKILVVDTDGDHDLSDEKPIQSYEIAKQSFTLAGFDAKQRVAPLTFAIYSDPREPSLELHFDDGGHGSHCAGIAAGYRIDGKDGFHGIAPGAEIMSLKIGNNELSGGSTTTGAKRRALDFVVDWAKKNNRPVVVNLSYGIGSEIEGQSAIDRAVNDFLSEEPSLVYLSTSAGNSGPGISTIGQPAAAHLAFTAGAVFTPPLTEMLYGAKAPTTRLFSFSSRGGDTNKPTAVLPGVAASTVPPFLTHDMMNGTSMAAPQGAGTIALLVEAAKRAKLMIHNGMVTRALRYSAKPLPGYTCIDQGGGLVSVRGAWDLLKKLATPSETPLVVGYNIETENPTLPIGKGPAAYWRVGNYLPSPNEGQTFTITPFFSKKATAKQKQEFFAVYTLKSDSDWFIPQTSSLYLRGEAEAEVQVSYAPSQLKQPGLYVGRIFGYATEPAAGATTPSFELLVTIIVPESLDSTEPLSFRRENVRLAPGELKRFFVPVPHTTTLVDIELDVDKNPGGWARVDVFDPQGREVLLTNNTADSLAGGQTQDRFVLDGQDPGVFEFVIYATFRNKAPVVTSLNLTLYNLILDPPTTLTIAPGEAPESHFTVINPSHQVFKGSAAGAIDGYARHHTLEGYTDTLEHMISVSEDTKEVTCSLEIEPTTFVDFTDVSVMILAPNGDVIAKDGFSQTKTIIRFQPPHKGTYRLAIQAARTYDSSDQWAVEIDERHVLRDPVTAKILLDGNSTFRLYPSKRTDLTLQLSDRPKVVPDGYSYSGELRFVDELSNKTWMIHSLRLQP